MMKRKKDQELLRVSDLSGVFFETMKEVAARGKEFSRDEITATLSKRSDIQYLFERVAAGNERQSKTIFPESDRRRDQADGIDQQKTMSVALTESKKIFEREQDFNKRMSLTLLNLCQVEGNERFTELLDEYKTLLAGNAELLRKEQLLSDLKNLMLRTDILTSNEKQKKPKTFLSRLIPAPRNDVNLDNLKKCYIELLEELKNVLGCDCARELDVITERIRISDDIDTIFSQRTPVVAVIEKYANQINCERANVTRFIKEIGEKLAELEKNLEFASGAAVEYKQEDEDFSKNIEQELRQVNDAIRGTDDLDELRKMVILRLDHVATLLVDKRKDYQGRIDKAEAERNKMLKNIDTVINDLQEQNRILEEQNRIDPLTGISNRRAFEERLNSELDRYRRYKTPFSIIFFDIDHFKLVNDKYGHTAGDRALRGIAQCATGALRKTDMLSRYGGEEFVIILPETPLEKSTQVARKLHRLIQDTEFDYDGNIVPITISVGVTEVQNSDSELGKILDRADKNTYRAKELGRNLVVSDLD